MSGLLLNPDLPMENDEPYYFVLAKSLSLQRGYKHIYYPGNLIDVEYPPLYPLFLALFMRFVTQEVIFLKVLSILFGIGALVVIYFLFFERCKSTSGEESRSLLPNIQHSSCLWLILLLTATNWWFLSFSVIIAPEIAYLFFSITALYFLEKYSQKSNLVNKYLFMMLLMLIVTFYTKSLGLAIILASFIYIFWAKRERKRGLFLVIISLFLIFPWFLKDIIITNTDKMISQNYLSQIFFGYKGSLLSSMKTIATNIFYYSKAISSLFIPGYFMGEPKFEGLSYSSCLCSLMNKDKLFNPQILPLFSFFIMVIFVGMTFIGFIREFIKKKGLIEIYVLCYLGLLIILPFGFYVNAGKRYLLSLLPFMLYYFFKGVSLFETWRLRIQRRPLDSPNYNQKGFLKGFSLQFITGSILLMGNLVPTFWSIKGNISYLANYRFLSEKEKRNYHSFWLNDYFTLAKWIRENTPPDAVLMHFFPAAFYLHTNRKTVFFNKIPYWPEKRDFHAIKADIEKGGVTHIIVGSPEQKEIIYRLNTELPQYVFIPIAEIEVNRVYRVIKVNPRVKEINRQGAFWYKEGNYGLAIAEFEKAQKIEPTFVGYFNLGRCYEEKGEKEKSLKMYKQAVRLEPDFEVCKIRFDIGYYRKLIEMDASNYQYYGEIGKCYLKNYRYSKAIDAFKEVLTLNPSFKLTHYNLGIAYLGNKDYEMAIIELKKALVLIPELKYKTKHYLKIANKLRPRNN